MKQIRIAQAAGQHWRQELYKHVKYRTTEHPASKKIPPDLLFNQKIRSKLPAFQPDDHTDLEVHDHDDESKGKAKLYAASRRNAKYSNVQIGRPSPHEAGEDQQTFYSLHSWPIHQCE